MNMKKRIRFFTVFMVLLLAEILIALFVHDAFVRPYLGDVIVVVLIYFFIRFIFPDGIRLLPLYVFMFSTAVEVGQYFDFVNLIGLGGNALAEVILGTSFSFVDIICYLAGALICAGYELFGKD